MPVAVAPPAIDTNAELIGEQWLEQLPSLAFDPAARSSSEDSRATLVHGKVLSAIKETLSRLDPGSRHVPRRPHLLPQLLNAINDNEHGSRSLANIITQDPTLTGNLLRLANSALYRVDSRRVDSADRAIAILGTEGLRQMVSVALLQPVMSLEGKPWGALFSLVWEHALLSSIVTIEGAQKFRQATAFDAQMLELMHGLGATVVVRVMRDTHARYPTVALDFREVEKLLRDWGPKLALELARHWEMPSSLITALEAQKSATPLSGLSGLAHASRVGRRVGAAALLYRHGQIHADEALAMMEGLGLRPPFNHQLWERISQTD